MLPKITLEVSEDALEALENLSEAILKTCSDEEERSNFAKIKGNFFGWMGFNITAEHFHKFSEQCKKDLPDIYDEFMTVRNYDVRSDIPQSGEVQLNPDIIIDDKCMLMWMIKPSEICRLRDIILG